MAKLLDPAEPARWTPDGEDGVSYLFRVPTVAGAARLDRETAAEGGASWTVGDVWRALRDGLDALAEHGDVAVDRAYVDDRIAMLGGMAERLGGAEGEARDQLLLELGELLVDPRMEEIASAVRPAYPRLRAMLADNTVWPELRGQVAARLFLVGWEGIGGEVRRGVAGVADETLRRIPRRHFPGIGAFVERLLAPTEEERGN